MRNQLLMLSLILCSSYASTFKVKSEISELIYDDHRSESRFILSSQKGDLLLKNLSHSEFYKNFKERSLLINQSSLKNPKQVLDIASLDYEYPQEKAANLGRFLKKKSRKIGTIIINTRDYDTQGKNGGNSINRIERRLAQLREYYKEVTHGQVLFDIEGVIIDGKPDIFTVNLDIDSKDFCKKNKPLEQIKLSRLAQRELKKIHGDNFFNGYDQKLFIMPSKKHMNCSFTGVGTVGTTKIIGTKVWLLQDKATLGLFVHEFGHNLGLRHSASDGKTYGDKTCPMGFTKTNNPYIPNPLKMMRLKSLHPQNMYFINKAKNQKVQLMSYNQKNINEKKDVVIKISKKIKGIKNDIYINFLTKQDFRNHGSYHWGQVSQSDSIIRITENLRPDSILADGFYFNAFWSNHLGQFEMGKKEVTHYYKDDEIIFSLFANINKKGIASIEVKFNDSI